MLNILLFLAALTAADLPAQGRFLSAGRADAGMILFDDALDRTGAMPRARVLTALAKPNNMDGQVARIVQFIEEYDCKQRMTRMTEAAIYSETGARLYHEAKVGPWSPPPPTSGREASLQHVCDGRDMPLAGTDLMTVLRAYWGSL